MRVGRKQATRKKTVPQRQQPRATSNAAISPPIEPQTYSQFSGSGYGARVPWPASVTNFSTMVSPFAASELRELFANAVVHPETGATLEYQALLKTDLRAE